MPEFRPFSRLCAALLGLTAATSSPADAQLAPMRAEPVRIENVATLNFTTAAGTQSLPSNRITLDVSRTKLPTRLSFRHLPDGYQFRGMKCQTSPSIVFTPGEVSVGDYAASTPLESLAIENPLMLVLESQGSNRDPDMRETAWINVMNGKRVEILPLLETGANTGIFAAAVPASGDFPEFRACDPTLDRKLDLRLSFTEDAYSLGSAVSLLIDPQGYVFDSVTGNLIDGATVSVIDDRTGLPAPVIGDDGLSRYPSTVTSGGSATDSSGRTYKFEPGRFRFPLMPTGTYRLKIVPPAGYRAPSTATPDAMKDFTGPQGGFQIIDASFGKAFTLSTPEPLFADIPVDPGTGAQLLLEKTASVRVASPGDVVQYRLRITNRDGTTAVRTPEISDTLPVGLRYRKGSARGTAQPAITSDGRTLNFQLKDLPAGASLDVRYTVEVAPGAPVGEAVNRARASASGIATNEASASVRIQPLLFTDALTLIGRVTEGNCGDPLSHRIGVPGIRLMLEDGTFVVTDRDGLYHIEGVRAGTHVVQIDTRSIPATHEAVACDSDTRQAGSAISRFVEAGGGALNRVDFQLRPTGKAAAVQAPLPVDVATDADAAGNRDWLAGLTPGIDWVFPQADHNPRAPALRVVIKHLPGQRVALRVNGAPVDPLTFDGSDSGAGVAISTWTGIPLDANPNARDTLLEATVLDANGATAATLTRTVHYATAPTHATFLPEKSRLVADGLTRPLVAVRLTDRDGRPARIGTMVPFAVDPPYAAAQDAELQQGRQLAGREHTAATARVVGDEGIAFVTLEPTTQAGAAHVTITLQDKDSPRQNIEFRPWLAASAQDWVVVGFGKGTVGWNALSKRTTPFPNGARGNAFIDGQMAFYAKGRIKGSWLLTVAYDSNRKYDADRGLLGTIDPDRYYTVYGDGSRQTYDAATRRKLYLRLERREFYALFGDFETGLVDTQLTRYSRTMNGAKAEYQGKRISFTGFAANSDQLYARDEIQGNGLSGPYRLSGTDIVPNSDKIRLETRDRFRSEKIVASKQLTRHIDYDIDTISGTIRFREPILSRDGDLNPNFIVVDYETAPGKSKKLAAGGRVAARFANGRVEVGASLLRDETIGTATVGGVDLKARIDAHTVVRAEAASGGRDGIRVNRAYLAEVEHHGAALDMLAYVRQQDANFGLGQQNAGEAGTRKIGFDGRLRLTDRLSIAASAWHQDNLQDPGQRMAGEARIDYRRDTGTLFAAAQFAHDTGILGSKTDSRLIALGATQRVFGQKVELSGQTQFAIGGDNSSVDFPIRHKIGASWQVRDGIRLIAEHEIADGARFKANGTRIGFDVSPWGGAKLLGTLNQERIGENGARSFAQYGLNQSLPISQHWTIDATLDASTTVRGAIPTGDVINPLHPVASGGSFGQDQINGDYQAVTLGGTFRADRWSWNGRVEYRRGSQTNRWGITTNLLRTLGEGKTVAAGIRMFQLKDKSGAKAISASGDIAIAFRPLDSRWSLLERFELRHERADTTIGAGNVLGVSAFAAGNQQSTRAINNLAINYRTGPEGAGHGLEASLYYGAKYLRGRYDEDKYEGFIDVIGMEIRKDLGHHFDISVNASMQHAWTAKAKAFSAGPALGFSPDGNIWVSAGYNVTGYRDRDFADARYTQQGPYVTMRLKFDQLALRRNAR